MNVVFWGTPQFAVTNLNALLASRHRVVGVVTQPDRPAGRGRKPKAPPIRERAEEAGVPVLQPERPRGDTFHSSLAALDGEIFVVAAYGAILPATVLALPPRGCINVHASLLPKLRGAAPVNWAIIRGFTETGVTIMRMVEALDAGPILRQARTEIGETMTAGELETRLAAMGAEALLQTLETIEAGEAVGLPQDDSQATYAPKLGRDEARVDWNLDAGAIGRWLRGCDPAPAAWSMLDDVRVRLFNPRVRDEDASGEPGVVVRADATEGLWVATGGGVLQVGEVQPAGKRRMSSEAWIRGRGVFEGARFR